MSAKGRPSLLRIEPKIGEAIVSAVGDGVPVNVAARSAGISPETVRKWVSRGMHATRKDSPFATFATAIAQARARAAEKNVLNLQRASEGGQLIQRVTEVEEKDDGTVNTKTTERYTAPDWRANAWWLERQLPEEFAKVERHEVSGPDGGPIFMAVGELYQRDPEARAAGLLIAQRAIESGMLDGEEA